MQRSRFLLSSLSPEPRNDFSNSILGRKRDPFVLAFLDRQLVFRFFPTLFAANRQPRNITKIIEWVRISVQILVARVSRTSIFLPFRACRIFPRRVNYSDTHFLPSIPFPFFSFRSVVAIERDITRSRNSKRKEGRKEKGERVATESQPLHERGRQIGPGGCKRRNYRRR